MPWLAGLGRPAAGRLHLPACPGE